MVCMKNKNDTGIVLVLTYKLMNILLVDKLQIIILH